MTTEILQIYSSHNFIMCAVWLVHVVPHFLNCVLFQRIYWLSMVWICSVLCS